MQRVGKLLSLLIIIQLIHSINSNECLTMIEEVNPKRVVHLDGQSLDISFELTRRPTQRLVTRIMKIFLIEVLGYPNVKLIDRDDWFDAVTVFSRMSETLTYSGHRIVPETMVNMEVWIPPQEDTIQLLNRYDVKECGSVTSPGRFGWFVPEKLSDPNDNWQMFKKPEQLLRFDITHDDDDDIFNIIKNSTFDSINEQYYCEESFCHNGMYIPNYCQKTLNINNNSVNNCALLLAGDSDITYFIKDHIEQLKLFVKVAWVGENLKNLTELLTEHYIKLNNNTNNIKINKSLVILHWTPSSTIPNERDFIAIEFPRCGSKNINNDCVYESNRLVKLSWSRLETIAKMAWETINHVKLNSSMYEDLIVRYNNLIRNNINEDEIACSWLKDNLNYTLNEWLPNNADKNSLIVGGIFPMSGSSYTAKSIVIAARLAKETINLNNTLLRDYNLTLLASDGQCKSDMVMKSFIDYIVHNYYEKLVGVLGPACSDTIEPLVGISRHYKTVIISYGAEGSTFNDRTRYPYFFRTIAENKQYRHAYLKLFQQFGWHRVAALTEDGQKYTEYISYMQELLRDNGINIIANIKFPRERESHEMTQYLLDLKQNRARIIIADVYDVVARQVMCEAFKLEMTAVQGYVWFLPLWLQSNWYDTNHYNKYGENIKCTTIEMMQAMNGHLGISHAYFGSDNQIMQEGITVREWRDKYERICKIANQPPSPYAGYAYDAMWIYAYAMDELIKENQSYVFDLHSDQTVNRLTEIIAATEFHGVSGNINFRGGPSRFSVIRIEQILNNETKIVGNFYPNISETKGEVIGGRLELNKSLIIWLSNKIPDDGSEPPARCVLGALSELLNVSCEVAIVIANIIGLGLLGGFSITGFIIVKRKYDKKVRQHEKVMESFGLDPRQTTCGLDKWEIPRERVVINRKIGEGAFGTVYGGETFFPEKGWLAVAVKTLKNGSTTDEKLDFLSEVEVMKRFEHKNIIKLLGVCIQNAPVLTVMEFMLYGDLKTYLLARRHLVNDQHYEDSDEISNKKLTAMALDVARALSYLAQLKYVHRDVASRNCLVNAQRIVKLGDFGMTRPMYEHDYYKFNRKGMLPVRWMAPESLGLGIFTPASDVWSYGVLLYEIVTFGSFPFQGMSNNQVLTHVKAGNSLEVPKGVKPQLEALIRSCWAVESTKRPTAPEIVDFLATNQRVVSPCLDVPLASVQLENSGQLDIPLPEAIRKFSMSLSWPSQRRSSSSASQLTPLNAVNNLSNSPLVDINNVNENNIDNLLFGIQNNEQDSSSWPLLSTADRLQMLIQGATIISSNDDNNDEVHKYINLQPGENQFLPNKNTQMQDKKQSDTVVLNDLINSNDNSVI
ncbi:hypothetical protein PV328_011532 [Microctonus aethiopoides]|uniref:Gamma-aminobutyric acid type B receptor subunit 2 n=1 Tax=Microctonus aethiopoides TaxID=144406 RepID=A0AA39C4V5_9HYME|nr:hypothetical protein PV328_011532 [Microctonus aethiopoides]